MTYLQQPDQAQIYLDHGEPIKQTEIDQIDLYLKNLPIARMNIETNDKGIQITVYDEVKRRCK